MKTIMAWVSGCQTAKNIGRIILYRLPTDIQPLEGFAIIDKIFTTKVNRTLPGLNNFLMAGQWVVPGGGVTPTLVSGKHAAMLLCRRDAKTFHTSSE